MPTGLEPTIVRFAALSERVSKGRRGADFCVVDPESSSDWLVTDLEKDLHAAVLELVEGLKTTPGDLDGAGVTRILVGLRLSETARDSRRADVGFGYVDFDSLCSSPLWDLRYRLRDAVEAQRAAGVDVLASADRAVLEARNGEFLTLLAVPSGETGRAKFRFTLSRLTRLAQGVDPARPEACTAVADLVECLRGLDRQLDWDVLEPGRMHYSDAGYEPTTHYGDEPNPDNLLWFFDTKALDQLLRALLACTPLIVLGVEKNVWPCLQVRREAAQLAHTLKWSLVEMAKVGRQVLEGADRALLDERTNGFARSYGDFIEDDEPGVLAP